jgi:hypothetical protein
VDTLDKLINKDTLRGAKVPNPQTPLSKHQFKYQILVTTYGNADRTNFSCQQTHVEFKPDIGHDPFQYVSDKGPNDSEEETVEDGDELEGVEGLKKR